MLKRQLYPVYRWLTALNQWMRRRFTRAGQLVLWSILLGTAAGIDTKFTMAYQAVAFLACLTAVSMSWSLLARGQFSGRRILPRVGTVGLPLAYRIRLQNQTARAQSNLVVMEDLGDGRPPLQQFLDTPEPGEEDRNWFDRICGYYRWRWLLWQNSGCKSRELALPALAPGAALEVFHELTPHRRGVLRLPALTVGWPDPFGLFRSVRSLPGAQSILVLPRRYPLPPLKLPGTRLHQPGGVTLASSVGESEEFIALREYRPGDPLRRIHWRSLAKIGKPVIKEYQDEFFARHALVLDTFASRVHPEVFEEAVSVAASFACTIPDQESLLDLLFVGQAAYHFTAGRSLALADQLLEILASVSISPRPDFEELERLVLGHTSFVTSCICVFLAWDEPRQRMVHRLRSLGVPVMVFVVSAARKAGEEKLDPGPLGDCAGCFHELVAGRIAEGLARV